MRPRCLIGPQSMADPLTGMGYLRAPVSWSGLKYAVFRTIGHPGLKLLGCDATLPSATLDHPRSLPVPGWAESKHQDESLQGRWVEERRG